MTMLFETVGHLLYGVAYMVIAYAFIYGNTLAMNRYSLSRGLDVIDAIEEQSNLAVALRRSGLILGLMIGMYGVIAGPSYGFITDLMLVAGYGALVSALFLGARIFNDFVILGHMSNTDEVKNGNVAVGWIEAGGFVATGIIAMSSMMGEGGGWTTALGFFAIGQILLLLVTVLYEVITPWSVREEVRKGNPAAGLKVGGLLVAVAVAIHGAIAIDFISWPFNLSVLVIEGSVAVILMMAISLGVDRIFLKRTDIQTEIVRDQNVAAITMIVALQIAGALCISAAVV